MLRRLICVVLLGLLCGCKDDLPTLYVYNWSDYIDPELIAEFEQVNSCHVVIDTFDDNESMVAKLLAGGGGYDVIFPSSYATPVMVRNKLVRKLDLRYLSHVLNNLDQKFKAHFHKDTLKYSIPYAFSLTGIVYRKDKLPKNHTVTNSWYLLKDPAFGGRMGMLRDVREVFGMGLRLCGESVNTTNKESIDEALDLLKGFKKCAAKLDNEQYRTAIVSGEMNISMGYACDVIQLKTDTPDLPIEFFIPDEGSTCCWDEIVIAEKARNPELAYAFIDFLYDPKVAARNMKYICATLPNSGMWEYLGDEERNDPWLNVPSNILEKVELIQDLGPDIELYNHAWDEFTTNRD